MQWHVVRYFFQRVEDVMATRTFEFLAIFCLVYGVVTMQLPEVCEVFTAHTTAYLPSFPRFFVRWQMVTQTFQPRVSTLTTGTCKFFTIRGLVEEVVLLQFEEAGQMSVAYTTISEFVVYILMRINMPS